MTVEIEQSETKAFPVTAKNEPLNDAIRSFIRDYRMARAHLSQGKPILIGDAFAGVKIESESAFHAWFMSALNKKINRRGSVFPSRWRKLDNDYQGSLKRDQMRLWQAYLHYRVYQFETGIVRKKFAHLLTDLQDQ